MTEYDFGGAFDVDPEMFFTREELDDLGYEAEEALQEKYENNEEITSISLGYIDCENTFTIVCGYDVNDEWQFDFRFKVDMRKIKKPSDLMKYKDEIVEAISRQIYTHILLEVEDGED